MNEIQNKLLHFTSLDKFNEKKTQIAPSSIAFVDEGPMIYTHGVEYYAMEDPIDFSGYATTDYVNSRLGNYVLNANLDNRIQTYINSMNPSWSSIVQRLSTIEGNDAQQQQAINEILSILDGFDGNITFSRLWNALSSADKTSHAAAIFSLVNANGSNIKLNADRIDLSGDTAALVAFIRSIFNNQNPTDPQDPQESQDPEGYSTLVSNVSSLISWRNSLPYLTDHGVVFSGLTNGNLLEFTDNRGFYHAKGTKSNFKFNPDGSGQIGYTSTNAPAITWNTNGVLSIHSSYFPENTGNSGNVGGGTSKYYDQAFKTTSTLSAPDTFPNNDWPDGADSEEGNNGWRHYAVNSDADQFVWMATRLMSITNGVEEPAGDWNGPWCITGPEGQRGADGTDIEFIYKLNGNPSQAPTGYNGLTGTAPDSSNVRQTVTFTSTSTPEYKTTDDFVPTGWSDNALSISDSADTNCCWISIRTKVDGYWTPFIAPILWSRWGQNGMDGDGIEYIFCAAADPGTLTGDYTDPSQWPTNSGQGKGGKSFQDAEYLGPALSPWTDDPIDLTTLGQGAKQYVSIRKYDGETGLWGAFCAPKLWSYYAKDGVVSGYYVHLGNQIMPISTDDNGSISTYTNKCTVSVQHNSTPVSADPSDSPDNFLVTIGDISRSDGGATTGISATHAINSSNSYEEIVTVTLSNVANLTGVNIFIPVTVTLPDSSTVTNTITCSCVSIGQPGYAFDLKTNVAAIRRDYYGNNVYPESLEVHVVKSGSDNVQVADYDATTAGSKFSFDYAYDDSISYTQLNTRSISLTANHDKITVRAWYNESGVHGSGFVFDAQEIPYVRDGRQGDVIYSTSYIITPVSSSLLLNSDTNKMSGSISFRVYKKSGNDDPILIETANYTADSKKVVLVINGNEISTSSITFDRANDYFTYTIPNNTSFNPSKPACAQIMVKTTTNTLVTTQVIPFIIKGVTGNTGTKGNFKSTVFKRTNDDISGTAPTGGTYDYPWPGCDGTTTTGSDGLTGRQDGHDGWYDGIPSGDGKIWASTCTFYGAGGNSGWSYPREQSESGTYEVIFSSVETPKNPNTDVNYMTDWSVPADISDWTTIIWRAERYLINGVPDGDWIVLKIKGERGEQGETRLQGLDGIVMRFWAPSGSTWQFDRVYTDGTTASSDGIRYKDIVYWNEVYWTPIGSTSMQPSYSSTAWIPFRMVDAAYIGTLISDQAYIDSLTVKQLVATRYDETISTDRVVAGVLSGSQIPTEMQGDQSRTASYNANYLGKYKNTSTNGIRIFAGAVPTTGNVADTAFNVDEEGNVKAGKGSILLNSDGSATFGGGTSKINGNGSGYLANRSLLWDQNGNVTLAGNGNSLSITTQNEYMYTVISAGGIEVHSKTTQSYGKFRINDEGEVVLSMYDKNGNLVINLGGTPNRLVNGEWIEHKLRKLDTGWESHVAASDGATYFTTTDSQCSVYYQLVLGTVTNSNNKVQYFLPPGSDYNPVAGTGGGWSTTDTDIINVRNTALFTGYASTTSKTYMEASIKALSYIPDGWYIKPNDGRFGVNADQNGPTNYWTEVYCYTNGKLDTTASDTNNTGIRIIRFPFQS